jgi:hypothetical protein
MPKTANEALLDEAIRHQIELQKYSNHVVRQMVSILNAVDADMFAQLSSALESMSPEQFTVQRLQAMLGSFRATNASAYAQVSKELTKELRDFTEFESQYQKMSLEHAFPFEFNVASVSVDQVYAAAMAKPFQGALLSSALEGLSAARAQRVERAIAHGYVEGKTSSAIVRELRGTKSSHYADGVTEIDRRNLQSIVQTAIAHTAAVTRDAVHKENADVLDGEMWSSTLDNKTTSLCRIRDHLLYTVDDHTPIGHDVPWLAGPGELHYNCRSCSVPVLKSWSELLGVDGINESDFLEGTRASMDGQVPRQTTYNEWLSKQSAERQDEVLGPVRGKLLREGKLAPEKMYTNRGEYMTLLQLRAKYPGAFRKAGL